MDPTPSPAHDLEAYLIWVFIRRGTHAKKYRLTAAELTPAAYKRAIEAD